MRSAPCDQNAIDIFAGDWTSGFAPTWGELKAGRLPLFADPRIAWAIEQVSGVQGKRVLELGPLEGGHTYMIESSGAASILSIEANTRAYLRCLIAKEIMGLQRSRFVCGDFTMFLRGTDQRFDFVVASGVLYHQIDPIQVIADIARVAPAVAIWTHYYDADLIARNPAVANRVTRSVEAETAGFKHQRYKYTYGSALDWSGFCGGSHPCANWLSRADILGALKHFGFRSLTIGFDTPDHENGPAFAIIARK